MSDTYTEEKKAASDRSADNSRSPSVLEASGGEDRFAGIDRKALLRRVDWRLLPYTLFAYMLVRLDLNNINNACVSSFFSSFFSN